MDNSNNNESTNNINNANTTENATPPVSPTPASRDWMTIFGTIIVPAVAVIIFVAVMIAAAVTQHKKSQIVYTNMIHAGSMVCANENSMMIYLQLIDSGYLNYAPLPPRVTCLPSPGDMYDIKITYSGPDVVAFELRNNKEFWTLRENIKNVAIDRSTGQISYVK